MNLLSRKPREIADAPKDYRPPEVRAAEQAIEVLSKRHCRIREAESEVMPPDGTVIRNTSASDTRPQQALKEVMPDNRLAGADPLAEIATLIRLLTYGEMIELAAALWRNRSDDAPVTQEALPGILHRWSNGKDSGRP